MSLAAIDCIRTGCLGGGENIGTVKFVFGFECVRNSNFVGGFGKFFSASESGLPLEQSGFGYF